MASTTIINLNLPAAADQHEQFIYNAFTDLVNGKDTPAATAQQLHSFILGRVQAEQTICSDPSTRCADPDTQLTIGPDPSGWQHLVWNGIGLSGIATPATHPGQDRLVEALVELQALPQTTVQGYNAIDDSLYPFELWTLTPANGWNGLEQWLWELNEGRFFSWALTESEENQQAYPNFSALLARLFGKGVVSTLRLSALIHSHFAMFGPGESNYSIEAYQASVEAAAQWIFHAGPALYALCHLNCPSGPSRYRPETWVRWAQKFSRVAEDVQCSEGTRETAKQTIKQMAQSQYEEESGRAVMEKLGLLTVGETEDEEEDEAVEGLEAEAENN